MIGGSNRLKKSVWRNVYSCVNESLVLNYKLPSHQHFSDYMSWSKSNYETNKHASYNRDQGFVNSSYSFYLKIVRSPKRKDEQHADQKQGPWWVVFFLIWWVDLLSWNRRSRCENVHDQWLRQCWAVYNALLPPFPLLYNIKLNVLTTWTVMPPPPSDTQLKDADYGRGYRLPNASTPLSRVFCSTWSLDTTTSTPVTSSWPISERDVTDAPTPAPTKSIGSPFLS